MKSIVAIAILMLSFGSLEAQDATTKTKKFKVYGNCGMCENRIEKAAKAIDGVSEADWDKETKMIEVTFNSDKTTLEDIHHSIADAGHGTDLKTAKDSTYDDLPCCCHYDRKKEK
ncbi:MAG: cation transporter [Bacteroidales bacterium]|nr:cation transporter [Bacteroidales bacterium]